MEIKLELKEWQVTARSWSYKFSFPPRLPKHLAARTQKSVHFVREEKAVGIPACVHNLAPFVKPWKSPCRTVVYVLCWTRSVCPEDGRTKGKTRCQAIKPLFGTYDHGEPLRYWASKHGKIKCGLFYLGMWWVWHFCVLSDCYGIVTQAGPSISYSLTCTLYTYKLSIFRVSSHKVIGVLLQVTVQNNVSYETLTNTIGLWPASEHAVSMRTLHTHLWGKLTTTSWVGVASTSSWHGNGSKQHQEVEIGIQVVQPVSNHRTVGGCRAG
jgi:hypothetical protein